MNKADIEFTVGLNTSPAEQSLSNLYKDIQSHNNRMQKLLDNPAKYSEQKYISNLSKLETMQNRYGIDKVNINSNLPSSEYHRFMNLQNSVARYEREMNKLSQKSNSVISATNTYSANKNMIDSHPGMFDARIKSVVEMELERLTTEENKSIARGSYQTWKNLTSNNILALPSPEDLDKNKQDSQDNKPAKEEVKALTEEDKKDNVELNDKLMKWGKIAGIIYSVKKVLEGLSKLWKFNAENISSRNANLNQDLGFFSVDPVGAMRANMDTTRAMMYAGVRNMGDNSPVSKEGLDYMSQKFTDLWTAAMSGREVDARTTIDVQRLKDFFGIDLSVAGLLTGEREGKTATDIQIDVMRKVEAQLAKLNDADQTTKGQVIDSLRNILGDEMVNAIVANYNKNMRSDTSVSLVDRLTSAGGSALNGMDLTDKTTKAVTALASFKESLEDLKNTIVVEFSPAFVEVTKALTSLVDWVNRKITDKKQDTLTPGAAGNSLVLNKDLKSTSEGDVFGDKSNRKKLAQEKLKNAKSADDILDAVYLLNPNLVNEGSLESIKQNQYINDAYDALASGVLDPDSANPLERYLANYEYGGKKGLEALKLAEKKGVFGRGKESGMWIFRQAIKGNRIQRPKREDYWKGPVGTMMYNNAETNYQTWFDFFKNFSMFSDFAKGEFGEGGGSDWTPEKGFFDYLLDPSYYKDADSYYEALQKYKDDMGAFGKEYVKSFNLPSKESLWGEDMKLQFDEVVFTLQTTTGEVLSSVRRTPTVSDLQ